MMIRNKNQSLFRLLRTKKSFESLSSSYHTSTFLRAGGKTAGIGLSNVRERTY